jgi:hypothetical protein
MIYEPQLRSFLLLSDLCRTFYAQARRRSVRNAQYSARFLPIENQVRLPEQAADIGARVMAGHRMIGVAKQDFAIFRRHAGRT